MGAASNICAKTAQVFGYWRPNATGLAREHEHEETKNNTDTTNGYLEDFDGQGTPDESGKVPVQEEKNNTETTNGYLENFDGQRIPSDESSNVPSHEGDNTDKSSKKKKSNKKKATTSRDTGQIEIKGQLSLY